MPLAGPKPDSVAQRGAAQPGLAMPHDLVAGIRIMLAVAISAKMGDESDGIAEPVRRRQVILEGIVAQEVEFMVGEHQLRLAIGYLAAEQRHDHDALGNHGVDGDCPLQPFGGAE